VLRKGLRLVFSVLWLPPPALAVKQWVALSARVKIWITPPTASEP